MASSARSKRLAREIPELREKNRNYFVNIKDEDLTKFEAYIVGPDDSCYAGKLVKLKIEVPPSYPYQPPKCTFIQKQGGRIHPNLYNQGGKVCLSILVRILEVLAPNLVKSNVAPGNLVRTCLGLYDENRHSLDYRSISAGREAYDP